MQARPEAFFITDHYRGCPAMCVRLSAVRRPELQALLAESWRQLAPKRLVAPPRGALVGMRHPRSRLVDVGAMRRRKA